MKNLIKCFNLFGIVKGREKLFLIITSLFFLVLPTNLLFAQTTSDLIQFRQLNQFNKGVSIRNQGNTFLLAPFAVQQADFLTNPLSQIIQALVGSGVTVSNIQTNLPQTSNIYGSFSGGTNVLGIETGLLMTTGSVFNALGPNISPYTSQDNGLPGYYAIDTAGFDAAVISFDVTSTTSFLSFKYVFASEEYNEFVGSVFNDDFAFLISGPGIPAGTNIALIPGSTQKVDINDINLGLNAQYYVNNDSAAVADPFRFQNLEYDGLTKVLVTSAITVVPGATYTITLVIQDVSDGVYDSGVFLEGGSITSDSCVLTLSTEKVDILCNGDNTGSIELEFNGAYGQAQILWSNGDTTNEISDLAAGFYNVTVTDARGCTATLSSPVAITEPSAITLNSPVITGAACGGANGSVIVSALGGIQPYQFILNGTTNNSGIFTDLQSGDYDYTVIDQNGCSNNGFLNVPVSSNLTLSTEKVDLLCHGDHDGSIALVINGANGQAQILWSNGETTSEISDLQAGYYNVTVTDAMGCTATLSAPVAIIEPPEITVNTVITAASCGGANGSAMLTALGGIPPYQFIINGTTNNTGIFTGLQGGYNTYTVIDQNGCSNKGFFDVPVGSILTLSTEKVDILCNGDHTGSIQLEINGANGQAQILWSNGETTSEISELAAGYYNVTVTDALGCTATLAAPVAITEPPAITLNTPVITAASCGGANGSAIVSALGGIPPYQFILNGITNNTGIFTGLQGGNNTYTVIDQNGCSKNGFFIVPVGANLICSINVTPNPTVSGQATYTIFKGYGPQTVKLTGSATNGAAPYNYNWGSAGTGSIINVSPNTTTTYNLTITDHNGCQSTCSVTIKVVDIRCGHGCGNNSQKVLVCHRTNGNHWNTICISPNAVPAHIFGSHHDYLGSCISGSHRTDGTSDDMDNNISEFTGDLYMNVYPNPISNMLNVEFDTPEAGEYQLQMFDNFGHKVLNTQGSAFAYSNKITVPIVDFSPGVYHLILNVGEHITSITLIVAK